MQESDTYLMILDEGQAKFAKEAIVAVGEERLGRCDESLRSLLFDITDLDRLRRMVRRAAKAGSWQEILDTR